MVRELPEFTRCPQQGSLGKRLAAPLEGRVEEETVPRGAALTSTLPLKLKGEERELVQ